jgi:small-conductance mechanosensitive channel
LTEPYSIGDEIVIGDQSGIVQEVDILVTRIESDGEEYIIPNKRVFNTGIVRIRG